MLTSSTKCENLTFIRLNNAILLRFEIVTPLPRYENEAN